MVCWIIQKKSTVKGSLRVHHTLSAENWHITSKEIMDHKKVSLDTEEAWEGKRKFLRFHISKTSYFISSLYIHKSTILTMNSFSWLHALHVIQQILQSHLLCGFFAVVQYCRIHKLFLEQTVENHGCYSCKNRYSGGLKFNRTVDVTEATSLKRGWHSLQKEFNSHFSLDS